ALAAVLVVGAALVGNYRLGPMPGWSELPDTHVSAHDDAVLRAAKVVPGGVVVSAANVLGAHLSARGRVPSFPYVQDAPWVAADSTAASGSAQTAYQGTSHGVATRSSPAQRPRRARPRQASRSSHRYASPKSAASPSAAAWPPRRWGIAKRDSWFAFRASGP